MPDDSVLPDSHAGAIKPPKPKRRVIHNTLFSVLTRTQGALFSYASTWLMLRAFSVEDYGLYSVLFTGTLVNLSMVVQLGIPNLLVRFIPEFYAQSRYRPIHRLFKMANIAQVSLAVVLLGVVWVLAPQIANLIHFPGRESAIRVFAFAALAYLLSENFHALLKGLFRQRMIFDITLAYNILRLGAIYYVTTRIGTLMSVVIVEGILFAFSVLLYAIEYHRRIRPLVIMEEDHGEAVSWPRYTRYAGLCYANEVGATLLSTATDLFLVSGFLGGFQAGLYGLANRITTMVQHLLPHKVLSEVIEPLFFSEYGASKENVRFGFNLLMKISLLVTLPMGIWLGIMARPVIVDLFNKEYAEAAPILAIQAFFLPMVVLRFALGLMLQNAERIDLLIYSKITGVLKIVMGLWIVPLYGVMGMVWLTSLALTAQNLFNYVNIRVNLRTTMDHLGLLRILINGALSAAALFFVRGYFHGVIGLAASAALYSVLYFALNVVHKSFSPEERNFLNTHLKRPLWVF
jgi:O-antigen/teichoic acid export membrane protein